MEDELIHDLVAGYALDALDDDERRAFEAHLATCDRCRDELEALAVPTLALAYGAPAAEVPSGLRNRVLAAARADHAVVSPLRPRWAYPALAVAVAASAAAVGLGIWAAIEHDRPGSQQALMTIPLNGASGAVVLTSGRRAALVVAGLAKAPAGKTYEAWVIAGTDVRPAGLFSAGGGVVVFRLTRAIPAGGEVAVTLEPAGGAPRPTSKPLLTSAPA